MDRDEGAVSHAGAELDALIARMQDLLVPLRDRGTSREAMTGGAEVRLLDRILSPLNRLGTKRFLKEARRPAATDAGQGQSPKPEEVRNARRP